MAPPQRSLAEGAWPNVHQLAFLFKTRGATIYRDLPGLGAVGHPMSGTRPAG